MMKASSMPTPMRTKIAMLHVWLYTTPTGGAQPEGRQSGETDREHRDAAHACTRAQERIESGAKAPTASRAGELRMSSDPRPARHGNSDKA